MNVAIEDFFLLKFKTKPQEQWPETRLQNAVRTSAMRCRKRPESYGTVKIASFKRSLVELLGLSPYHRQNQRAGMLRIVEDGVGCWHYSCVAAGVSPRVQIPVEPREITAAHLQPNPVPF